MHVAMPLAAWSEHIWWSSVLRIRVAIVLVRWVGGGRRAVPTAWGRDGGEGAGEEGCLHFAP